MKLPIGIQDFEKIRTGGYAYIDKPMLQAIGNKELQDEFRSTLKSFYGALKSMDGCIKFALLMGVTKFGKVSVFSDLNNLNDISLDYEYHDICGISEKELLDIFPERIGMMAERNGITREECIARFRNMYDGYHFEENAPGMYNPFSLLNAFQKTNSAVTGLRRVRRPISSRFCATTTTTLRTWLSRR